MLIISIFTPKVGQWENRDWLGKRILLFCCLCLSHPTLSAKALCFPAIRLLRSFVRLSRQIF